MLKLNGHIITPTRFPDKTTQVWQLSPSILQPDWECHDVEWLFEEESEFLLVAQIKTLLDLQGRPITLHMPFLPYARQDKDISNETTFALHAFATLLNSLNFDRVTAIDPHSPIAATIIDNFEAIEPTIFIESVVRKIKPDVICYPDFFARERYNQLVPFENVHAMKERNPLTGEIIKYELIGDVKGKNVLIVDDICDGGATFIFATKELLKRGATEVHLYVSHGIFSKGLEVLREAGINRIFTKEGEVI